jgi:hypothetical protein
MLGSTLRRASAEKGALLLGKVAGKRSSCFFLVALVFSYLVALLLFQLRGVRCRHNQHSEQSEHSFLGYSTVNPPSLVSSSDQTIFQRELHCIATDSCPGHALAVSTTRTAHLHDLILGSFYPLRLLVFLFFPFLLSFLSLSLSLSLSSFLNSPLLFPFSSAHQHTCTHSLSLPPLPTTHRARTLPLCPSLIQINNGRP